MSYNSTFEQRPSITKLGDKVKWDTIYETELAPLMMARNWMKKML